MTRAQHRALELFAKGGFVRANGRDLVWYSTARMQDSVSHTIVLALAKQNLVTYKTGGNANANITDAGRARLAELPPLEKP